MASGEREVRVRIGERVRAAHLGHYCPGGLGFPVTSPNSVGLSLEDAHFIRRSWLIVDDHAARVAGPVCARCRQPIEVSHDVRRRVGGDWVHENCPLPMRAAA